MLMDEGVFNSLRRDITDHDHGVAEGTRQTAKVAKELDERGVPADDGQHIRGILGEGNRLVATVLLRNIRRQSFWTLSVCHKMCWRKAWLLFEYPENPQNASYPISMTVILLSVLPCRRGHETRMSDQLMKGTPAEMLLRPTGELLLCLETRRDTNTTDSASHRTRYHHPVRRVCRTSRAQDELRAQESEAQTERHSRAWDELYVHRILFLFLVFICLTSPGVSLLVID